jgi:SAM-dependent methyltransferase
MPETGELYDLPDLYDLVMRGVPGDAEYFAEIAADAGRVLELACGTGRVTIPMARAGAKVTAFDLSPRMLEAADQRLQSEPDEVRKRVTLFEGDMRGFEAGRKFPLIVIPFRAFQHLHEVADQIACLQCCRDHLARNGRLVVNVFDPNLRTLAAFLGTLGTAARKMHEVEVPDGHVSVFSTRLSCLEEQRFREEFVFEKFDADGHSQWRRAMRLNLRYFYRYEMEHLFELSGLEVLKLEGGFQGQPYRHGGEQVWTVRPKRARKP